MDNQNDNNTYHLQPPATSLALQHGYQHPTSNTYYINQLNRLHYDYFNQQQQMSQNQPSNMNSSISNVALPMQCNLVSNVLPTNQNPSGISQCLPQPMTTTITTNCSQHQPIYDQIYQNLQSSSYQQSSFQPPLFTTSDNSSKTNLSLDQHQQRLLVNTNRPFQHPIDTGLQLGTFNIDQQCLHNQQLSSQKPSFIISRNFVQQPANIDKSSSILTQFSHNNSPFVSTNNDNLIWQNSDNITTTNQLSKLVESSIDESTTTKTSKVSTQLANSAIDNVIEGKFKSYLNHLVSTFSIPFAYGIISVAFLVTVIAASSIIAILTFILSITGYTAYPITENTFSISLVIGVVCASIALFIVTIVLMYCRRYYQAAYYYLDDPQTASRNTNSPQLSETYDDTEYGSIPVAEWDKHVQKLHKDGDIGFTREFEQIQNSANPNLTYEHSQLTENKHKNRYVNIVAYDHTRVTLRQLPGQKKPGLDYINANFIDVSIQKKNDRNID